MRPSKPWFAPKRYGYGSGLPIAWQGWVVLAVYMAVAVVIPIGLVVLIPKPALLIPAIIGAEVIPTLILCVICARKTEGGWRWRWGGKP